MSSKGNNSVIKLVGNKIFITLLVFAIAIILVSAAFNRNMQKVAQEQPEYEVEIPVAAETEIEPEVIETVIENDYETEAEAVPVIKELNYRLPIAGELQKEFSTEELLWDETMEDWRTHNGVDIAAEPGTEVVTCASGTVEEAYEDEMFGIVVKVRHGDGVVSIYKNLEKTVVKKDDVLDEGQMIGTVGNTGGFESAQGPHLHFEMLKEEKNINPLEFIK